MPKFSAPDKGYVENTSYTTDAANYPVGATAVTLVGGSGEVVPGDTLTFAGDSTGYIAKSGKSGTINIEPGLAKPIKGAVAVTVNAQPPKDKADQAELAAIYNGLQTQAAQAWFVSGPAKSLGEGLGRHYGVPFYEWLHGIIGLAKPESYSGPEGEVEIKSTEAKHKEADERAKARADAAAKAEAEAAKAAKKAA